MAGPWDAFEKYNVHQECKDLTDVLIKKGARPFSTYPINEAREAFKDICLAAAGIVNFDGQVQELIIPSPHCKEGIQASVYKPNKLAATPAILIYIHGGGLCMFERKYYEPSLQLVAQEAGCIIVNIDYRLLPDQGPGLAPFDDALAATKWVLENTKTIGGQPGSKVGIGGDSSGGQIAISVTNDVKGLAFQVLLYPQCDLTLSKPSVQEFANLPVLPNVDLVWFTKMVEELLPNYATDPRVSPLARTNLKSAPPALIIHAEIDPLRDGGVAFAEKLKAAGVNVRTTTIKGVTHIFFGMLAIFKTKIAETRAHIVKFIKEYQ